jgi:hypothetical protein
MTLKELIELLGPPPSLRRWQQACNLLQQAYTADPEGFEARWLDPIESLVEQVPAHMRLCHPGWYLDALKGVSHPGLRLARVWYPMTGPGFSDGDALAAMRLAPDPGPDALAVIGSEASLRQRWLDAWPHRKTLRVLNLENNYRGDPAAMVLPELIEGLGLENFVLSDVNALPALRMLRLQKIKRPVQKGELLPIGRWAGNLEGLSLREVSSKLVLEWLSTLEFPNLTHLALSNLSGTTGCNDELFRILLERLPKLRVLRLSRFDGERAMTSLRDVLPRLKERGFEVLALHDPSLDPAEVPALSRWSEGYHPLEERLDSLSHQNSWLSQLFYPPVAYEDRGEVDWS